jgi:hypothetical protein
MDAAMKEAGLDEVKKELQTIKNPMTAVKDSVSAELKKQDEGFKQYFGTLNDAAKPASPAATPAEAPAVPAPPAHVETAAASDMKQAS